MRIVIDAYQMTAAITGTDRQARNVLRELQHLDRVNDYIVIVNADNSFVSDIIIAPNFTLRPTLFKKRASWILFGLPFLLLKLRADVFFSFHNLTAPSLPLCRSVASALDLVPFLYQKSYYKGWKAYWFRRLIVLGYMRISTMTASAFLANSNFTRDAMVEYFHMNPKRFCVAYLQADPIFFEPIKRDEIQRAREQYDLPQSYIFTLGAAEPRKNVKNLALAHRAMPLDLRKKYPLLVGGSKWQNEDAHFSNDPYIQLTGFIQDVDLPAVYHEATVFAFPSFYEGFGLPLLEAMAVGTPVITSTATSLPEAAGEAAILVDPDNITELTHQLEQILTRPELRNDLIKKGRLHVETFSWKSNAERLLKLLIP